MINLSKSGDTIVFEFINNGHYLNNGTIEVPVNSLSLVTDSSNMCTFYKANSNDIFISATYDELGKTKAEMLEWFEENMVAPQGGGGGGVTSGQVQTMIDDSVSGFADSVLYNSTSKYVEFYHGGSGGTKVYEFDASDFVIDGMVDDVRIETISGVSYLVIDFNTASGKEDIQIPLTDIFDPSNYYTKTEVDQALSGKQDTLISGTNIKTINNESILGSGNIDIQGGGGGGVNVVQTTGTSTTDVMSQDAVTTQLNGKGDAIGLDMVGSPRKKVTFQLKSGGINGTTISWEDLTLGRGLVYGEEGFTTLSTSGLVETSAITSAVTSASTDSEVPSAKAVYDVLSGKQDTLSAGTNITIVDNVISAEGGGKAVSGGTNISITTGETADTINCTLKAANTSGTGSLKLAFFNATDATGVYSVATGYDSKANGHYSLASGRGNITNNYGEAALGFFNKSNGSSSTVGNISGNTLFSVGNGTSNLARHNAFEIRQNGDIYLTKDGQDVKLQDQLGGGSITVDTALDSGSTNPVENRVIYNKIDEVEQVTAAALNNLSDNFDGLKLKKLTQAQYDALSPNYDNNTLYVIV